MTILTPHRIAAATTLRELGYPNNNLHVYSAGYYESTDENGDLCKSDHLVFYYIITDESEKNEDNIGEWFFDAVNTMLRKKIDEKKIKTNKNSKRIEIRLSNKETLRLIDFWSSAELTKDMVETFIM
ncbi:MAG: hypothetical protein IKW12_03280 [Clostridia bacterium]|nr:hypothetical protein [Clostridia bacterium]